MDGVSGAPGERLAAAVGIAERLTAGIETVLRGKREELKLVLAALACEGHVLFEDVPGTGKTVLARAIARCLEDAAFSRVQCTPDLQPGDVTGLSVYDQKTRDFEFRPGPVFANVVLVDEINRAMPKTQSALLEAMAERQITVDGTTHELPQPFLVLATENPIEFEGVFPLPEAQLDRFFLKARLGYPSAEEELLVIRDQRGGHPLERLRAALGLDELRRLQAAVDDVYVDPLIERWLVDLVRATRQLEQVTIGASVRGQPRARAGGARLGAAARPELRPARGRARAVRARARPPRRARARVPRRDARCAARGAARDAGRPLRRDRAGPRACSRARGAVSTELTFPLVPRWRPVGSPFGRLRASRRGLGSSVAGSRPYRRGDSLAAIDWKASARLSSTRAEPEFVVREHFADEAPRVVMVADRRPSMGLYPEPWLSKPTALRALWKLVSSTALGELGLVGYLDASGPRTASWLAAERGRRARARRSAPGRLAVRGRRRRARRRVRASRRRPPLAAARNLRLRLLGLPRRRPNPAWWARALAYRWDVVPVILQDPVWEQSFPAVEGLVVPVRRPGHGQDACDSSPPRRGRRAPPGKRGAARRSSSASCARSASSRSSSRAPTSRPSLEALSTWGETRLAVRRGEW